MSCNRWSAVQSSEAKHDPSLAKRAPKPAAGPSSDTSAAAPTKAGDKKPAAGSAAGQIAGIMTGVRYRVLAFVSVYKRKLHILEHNWSISSHSKLEELPL